MVITKAEAERGALVEWQRWDGNKHSIGTPLAFYNWLANDPRRDRLVGFRCSGDPYQVIQGWINRWRRLGH